ncbi:uncharacterized protein LOC101770582 [Setaria italica]|uniref:uncharacterized protein LOC101770582 n=1 Tax=Setaria italica TaxID=4555 RepID=UPI000BE5A1AF|nr:uncharacterized protein LOC101770582 [Setaria italica]
MDQPPQITLEAEGMLLQMVSQGMDAHVLHGMDLMYDFLRSSLPDPPVYADAYLSADFSSAGDGAGAEEDRISALPDEIIRNVVSRLPAKNAALALRALPGAPPAIFSLASVRCLHLGLWRFPNTADLPRGALRELTLGCVVMEDRDLDFVLARSPVLETLVLYSSQKQVNLRIVSSSLRCVQLCTCIVEDVAVVEAPHLERLFLWETIRCVPGDRVRTRIKFGHGSNLRSVGFLVPGVHVLEVGDTVIKASPNTIVPSVKILALKVHFGVRNGAKMLPSFLRCFPSVETLHIESEKADQPTGTLSHKFWQEACRTECVQSHIREIVFHEGNKVSLPSLSSSWRMQRRCSRWQLCLPMTVSLQGLWRPPN